jgi:low affinity Fe/Cu permease
MTLDALIMLSGALVGILPFLGFPTRWNMFILLTLGIVIVCLGVVVRRAKDRRMQPMEAPLEDGEVS